MLNSKKILIVDDEKRIRSIYNNLLTAEGFKVIEASNAMETVEILKKKSVDLILLDIRMPKIDGRTLYEVIRESDGESKIIVSSVYSIEDQKLMISGATGYYDKSQGIDILLAKIKEAMGNGTIKKHTYN